MTRYLLLVALNVPVLITALVITIASYKMGQIGKQRLIWRTAFWSAAIFAVVAAFPLYNYAQNRPVFSIHDISLLEIVLVTAVIYLTLITTRLAQKIKNLERTQRDLHQILSLKLSEGTEQTKKK